MERGEVEGWSTAELEAELGRLRALEAARHRDHPEPAEPEEVSARVTRALLETLDARVGRETVDGLLRGADLDPVDVRRRRAWWSWSGYCAVARALEPLAESGAVREACRGLTATPALQFLRIASSPLTPLAPVLGAMSRLVSGPGGILLRGFDLTVQRRSPTLVELRIEPPARGEPLPLVFVEAVRGFFDGMPATVDSGAVEVSVRAEGRAAVFGIHHAAPTRLGRARGLMERLLPRIEPQAVRDAETELASRNDELRRRILELEASERARAALQAELVEQERMEVVGRLAGGIAHDFNNLLTVVLARVDALTPRVDDEETRADLAMIGEASQRAASLCRQLLAVGRRQPMDVTLVDLRDLVQQRRELFAAAVGETITARFELEETGRIRADGASLERVLLDLVENARAAMPEGGSLIVRTGHLVVDENDARYAGAAPGPYALLTTVDDGVGMDAEVRARALEPFFTTRREAGARGLGLSSAFGVVRQLGGTLALRSAPGEGTEVQILVPRVEAG